MKMGGENRGAKGENLSRDETSGRGVTSDDTDLLDKKKIGLNGTHMQVYILSQLKCTPLKLR